MKKNYNFKKGRPLNILFLCFLILMSYTSMAQNLNFTIDTAVDNGTNITETIVSGPDTYVLTVFHSGNEELLDIGGGDFIFYHSAINPFDPHVLSITRNGSPANFTLNGVDYDTVAAGTISITNQDNAEISSPTAYSVGFGAMPITNMVNATGITSFNIIPTATLDLNNFGFHNINVDMATACMPPAGVATFVSQDCGAAEFFAEVNVTALGGGTPSIFDGTTTTPVAATGVISFGPYPIGTPINFTLQHGSDTGCDVDLGSISDTCPPPCTSPEGTAILNSQDCGAETFLIDVNVTSLGSGGSPVIFDGTTSTPVAVTGITTLGPYTIGTVISITLQHGSDITCDADLGMVSSTCDEIIFTIDTAVDDGTDITETIVDGPDTYILTVSHSGNEELDNLGGGDLIFFHSATNPLDPHVLSITKNGLATNFTLKGIDYDALGTGIISVTNQNDAEISSPTTYPLGTGTIGITSMVNATDISSFNILSPISGDLNDFGFHNIKVDIISCDASFTYSMPSYCTDNTDPVPTITGTTGGMFSSDPGLIIIASTGVIDVSTSTPGTYTVTYTVSGSCSDTASVTVNALDDASFNYSAASYCTNDTDPTPTITGLAGGAFTSGAGLSINAGSGVLDVSASTPGTYTVTYTTAGTCPNSSSVSVTVNALDDASFNYSAASYCTNDTDPTPTITGLAGGTFTSGAGLVINASTGVLDVSASTPGTYTVTYTTAGTCPNSSSVSVTVNALDDASFNYSAASYCTNDTDPTPTITGLAGGTFTSGAGLSINAGTGVLDVSASTPGTYTVTYTTAGTCPNSSSVSVTVNALDDASFNYSAASYCTNDTDPTPTITGLAGGTFTSEAGLVINASTGVLDVSASTPGTYTVTYTTVGTCPNSSSVGVVINTCIPNDECTGAIAVTCGETVTGSTVTATDSGSNPSNDVFYSFTDTVLQDVSLSLCNSDYDTYVRIFDDCPQTNEIAGNDDSGNCVGNQSEVTFTAQPNVTYYIMIEGYSGQEGNYDMSVTCIPNVPAPGNDLCANPTGLTLASTLSGETTAGATDSTVGVGDDTACQPFTFKSDVWYTFVAPLSGEVTIETVTTGTSTAASIALYPNCGQLDTESLGCIVGDATGATLAVTGLSSGITYYVRVWSDGVAARNGQRIEGTFDITASDTATLSTTDFDTDTAFSYYPNPVNTMLTLNSKKEISNVSVFNMLGQEVFNTIPNSLAVDLDMSNLQIGAYFVRVTMGNVTETIRVIKE